MKTEKRGRFERPLSFRGGRRLRRGCAKANEASSCSARTDYTQHRGPAKRGGLEI